MTVMERCPVGGAAGAGLRQRGLSLIELMVGLTVGLVISGGNITIEQLREILDES